MQDRALRMTEGSPSRLILRFAAPLFLGQLFQLLYNLVDSLVVGNYLDANALAAVVSSGTLINLFVNLFTGTFMGAGVVIALHYGAGRIRELQQCVHTTVFFALLMGVVMSLVGVFLTPVLLRLVATPENILPHSILYFRIYFSGSLFSVVYSACSSILQSVGDSRTPLVLLILSAVINTVLDLLMVGVFHMGVDGAALATVISQFLCALLIMVKLTRVDALYRLRFRELSIHREQLRRILKNGIPAGMQNSMINIANVLVQYAINTYGELAVAGSGIYSKVSGFAFLPIGSIAMALATFVGQNLGAGKPQRAKKGASFGIWTGILLAEAFGVFFYFFCPKILSIFTQDEGVLAYGVLYAKTVAPFYLLLAYAHLVAGVMRGSGRAAVPMIVMGSIWCVLRVVYILLVALPSGDIQNLYWAYPLTWGLSFIVFFIYYHRVNWTELKSA